MTNPYRAMCSELVTAVDLLCGSGDSPGQPGSRLILTVHVEALDELANRARALLDQPEPEETGIHYSWELHDAEGDWQAGGSAITLESVRREGNHYLQIYSQDGPHTLIIYRASAIEEVTND